MGEVCSHVSALLFYLEHMKSTNEKELPGNVSCTSKLQQWHVPPKWVVTPAPVSDINFRKAEYGKEIDIHPKPTNYDPRQPGDRMLDPEKVYTFLENLKSICPDAGIMHFWDTSSPSLSPEPVSTGWEAADASSVGSSHSLLSVASSLKNESIPLSKNSCQCCHDCGEIQGLNLGISCLYLFNSNFSTDAWSEHKRCGSPAGVSYINRKIRGRQALKNSYICMVLDIFW